MNIRLFLNATCLALVIFALYPKENLAIAPTKPDNHSIYIFKSFYVPEERVITSTVSTSHSDIKKSTLKPIINLTSREWKSDSNVSWYGPGFYGHRTACGKELTTTLLGVAHKTLPCGTLVSFKYKTRSITVPVVDRGPYIPGRQWDLTGGLCVFLKHCFTGGLEYKIEE